MTSRIKQILAYGAAGLLAAGNTTASAQTALALAGGPPAATLKSGPGEGAPRDVISIPKGASASIDFDFDIRTVNYTDPAVVDVTLVTPRKAIISAKGYGDTDVRFFDALGRQVLLRNVHVAQDLSALDQMISMVAPDAHVRTSSFNDKILITGTTPNNSQLDKVVQLAASYAGGTDKLINYVSSEGNDLVMLKIEVVEVNRNQIKQLGLNTNAIFGQLGMDQWAIGNSPTYAVNGGFQGGFGGGYSRNTTSQPVGTSAASLFANLFNVPFGTTGITNATIGQFVDTFLTGGTLTSPQSTWVSDYLRQYAGQVQIVDAVTSQTYTMADVGVSAANLQTQAQAYLNGTSALDAHGKEWMRKFLSSLPNSANPFFANTANPASTFIDRTNPANPVATGRVGSAGTNQAQDIVQAFERVGLIKTLAEPNGTVISGQPYVFKAGGQFPAPTGVDKNGQVAYEYKDYGVGMTFTPTVLSGGNISLKIAAQVSELSSVGSQTVFVGNASTTLPGLTVRNASTTLEMPAGGSIMLGGLLQDTTRENIDKVPGVADMPILGALARSRDYQSGQTELVIIATVELVHPTSRDQLQTPADGLRIASDMSTILMGKLNDAYKAPPAAVEGRTYEGPFGNVID